MKIVYGKSLTPIEESIVNNVALECGILFDTARVLYYRNIDSVEKAKEFLYPSKSKFIDPFLFNNMQGVVERINLAKENGETILICGDYDADGICATTILYKVLREIGINTLTLIPERDEGYGINIKKIEEICDEIIVDLVITVDCGISEREKIAELMDLGIDVIVSDHHEPPEILPDCLIVNPKVKDSGYTFDGLCGAGVAYKIGFALIGDRANKYLDYVALATVADSMDLVSENRSLVYEGLKLFNNKLRTAFKYLIGDNNREITAQTLAYNIGPRVNAGGRMGDVNSALKLFLSEDENEIFDLAVKLNEYNINRQAGVDDIYKQSLEVIRENKLNDKNVILVKNESWNAGFIGIVASKLVEKFNKPVIVFAGQDGFLKGSARSIDGINIYNAIASAKEYLIDFGGHSQAAGVSVSNENFDDFYKAISKYLYENTEEKEEKEIYVEWKIEEEFSVEFARELDLLEPFGTGNRKPNFLIETESVLSNPIKKESPHFSIKMNEIELLDFNGANDVLPLSLPLKKALVFEPNFSVFRDKHQVKGYLKNIIFLDKNYSKLDKYFLRNELLKIKELSTNFDCQTVDKIGSVSSGFGTLFVVSNYNVLSNFKVDENVEIYAFDMDKNNGKNAVIISPRVIPENYSKIVYLDKPLSICKTEKNTLIFNKASNVFTRLLTERDIFTEIYSYLISLEGKYFENSIECLKSRMVPFDDNQFIFVFEVFYELGFFYIDNGVLKRNNNVKSALTNSKIYNRICAISEEV